MLKNIRDIKEIQTLEFNYDNIELLQIINYLTNVVINDIELMNDLTNEKDSYDLGNNYTIDNEDLESLVSSEELTKNIVDKNMA